MTRRLAALLVLGALALCACREERVTLAPKTEELLRARADEAVAALIRQPEAPPFAAIVVFRSDVFLYQSATIERLNISLLDSFDNVAVLLLDRHNTPPLLAEDSVRKVRFLCPPTVLARFHPAFLFSVLRLFGDDREKLPIPFFAQFRELPTEKEIRAVQDAGFEIRSRDGKVLSLFGPPAAFPRLLAMNGIAQLEGASKLRTL